MSDIDWTDQVAKQLADKYWSGRAGDEWSVSLKDLKEALQKTRADAVRSFTREIFHGDAVHRVWLMEAADAFIAGKPMPPPRDATTHKE